jgi:hypothetical protein
MMRDLFPIFPVFRPTVPWTNLIDDSGGNLCPFVQRAEAVEPASVAPL